MNAPIPKKNLLPSDEGGSQGDRTTQPSLDAPPGLAPVPAVVSPLADQFDSYRQLVSELEVALASLEKFEADIGKLDGQRAVIAEERAKLLDASVRDESEELIDKIAWLNAKLQVFDNRREALAAGLERAEVETQLAVVSAGHQLSTLYRAARTALVTTCTQKLVDLIHPDLRLIHQNSAYNLAVLFAEVINLERGLLIELPLDVGNPLADTIGVQWSAQRSQTMTIVRRFGAEILAKATGLLAAAEKLIPAATEASQQEAA
jgi:hypothetical protein